jgi:hypothetical protein
MIEASRLSLWTMACSTRSSERTPPRFCKRAAATSSLGMSGGSNRLGITAFTVGWRCTGRALRPRTPARLFSHVRRHMMRAHSTSISSQGRPWPQLAPHMEQAAHRGRVRRQTDAQRRPIRSDRPSGGTHFPTCATSAAAVSDRASDGCCECCVGGLAKTEPKENVIVPAPGSSEDVDLLEKGLGCTLPE